MDWFAVTMGMIAGIVLTSIGFAASRRERRPGERELIEFATQLDEVERVWKDAGVGVGIGYSMDYETGVSLVTFRAANTGEDVTLRVDHPGVTRRRRDIAETLGMTVELPPSLRGDA